MKFTANILEALGSLKVNGKTITDISSSVPSSGGSDDIIPTQKAVVAAISVGGGGGGMTKWRVSGGTGSTEDVDNDRLVKFQQSTVIGTDISVGLGHNEVLVGIKINDNSITEDLLKLDSHTTVEDVPVCSDGVGGFRYVNSSLQKIYANVPNLGTYINVSGIVVEDLKAVAEFITAFNVLKYVYVSGGAPSFDKAKNTDMDKFGGFGLYVHNSSTVIGSSARILLEGYFERLSTKWDPADINKPLYLDSNGTFTLVKPTAAGQYIQIIGRVVSETIGYFKPSNMIEII